MHNQRMTSPSLQFKIQKLRQAAPLEVPKARLCSDVVHALLTGGQKKELTDALQRLREGCGSNWSATHAFQFMSGRRGEFAADCGTPEEKPYLFLAHLLAKEVCNKYGLGAVERMDQLDVVKLQALVASVQQAHGS